MIEINTNLGTCAAGGLFAKITAGLGGRLTLWHRNHRTRGQLSRLNDQQLADIGLRPADRARECQKWFWQK
ncbi:MAG: DUF1127 domain-containing protein [Alphaproteobacteria bacterium]